LHLVAEETEISSILIESKSRLADVVDARQMVVWFCFKARMSPGVIAKKVGISRQAVCQKISTIGEKRMLQSFDFNFRRIEAQFVKLFPVDGCK
jgi:chromosomal replication initiation ATPase DnaA